MKRTSGKIKDFVQPQAFDAVHDYANDPKRALDAYKFTDVTSDLLARWLDVLADLPRESGAARALAGLRGVGKSHTLATFSGLAAVPNLRSTVSDGHVGTSARRLLSHPYFIVRVERGTRPTLREEMAHAFATVFGGDQSQWSGDPSKLLAVAASMSHTPFVVIIDTAFGHEDRVHRDDGPLLAEIAKATKDVSAFIGLALDDDIEGADGANVALAGTYQIDYLDPEHLYRIADIHLFQKNDKSRTALHGVYTSLRETVPGFNWSEQRFASIYPVHPVVADVAHAVRLYVSTFSFLAFAADAGVKAINRPALSLIALDEVFDQTESELRKAENLEGAFASYDDLVLHTLSTLPVMQRLQARLALKGLFILSLDGRGGSARELAAAMLLYDEAVPPAVSIERVEKMLTTFLEAKPNDILSQPGIDGEGVYQFRIATAITFDAELAAALERTSIDDAVARELLRVAARSRFGDWPLYDRGGKSVESVDFTVTWRGTDRKGTLCSRQLPSNGTAPGIASPVEQRFKEEWRIVVLGINEEPDGSLLQQRNDSGGIAPMATETKEATVAEAPVLAFWQPAPLADAEKEILCRFIAFKTDARLLKNFGDESRSLARSYSSQVESVWSRIYLAEGKIITKNKEQEFKEEARAVSTLREALEIVVEPLLSERYPQHPVFESHLTEADVNRLIGDFFGSANSGDTIVQELARVFAFPLGLAGRQDDAYKPEAGDEALRHPSIQQIVSLADKAAGQMVPISSVYEILSSAPYGFAPECQRLILAALVAERRVELITTTGERINRRKLDKRPNWDTIAGVAGDSTLLLDGENLRQWAGMLSRRDISGSISEPANRVEIRAALTVWLEEWNRWPIPEMDGIPEEGLTTRAWEVALAVRKSFGAAAEAVDSALTDQLSLEEGLQRVADAFGQSPEVFDQRTTQLEDLKNFASGLLKREQVRVYVSMANPTEIGEIESARRELLAIVNDAHSLFEVEVSKRFDMLWEAFHSRYIEHYAGLHDEVVGPSSDRRAIDTLTRSDEWRDFESLAELSIVNRRYWEEAVSLLRAAKLAQCKLPVRKILLKRPICECSFRPSHAKFLSRVPLELDEKIRIGRIAFRRTLAFVKSQLAISLDTLSRTETLPEDAEHARTLSAAFSQGPLPSFFVRADVRLIERAVQGMSTAAPVRVNLPEDEYGLLPREELRARLNQWLDDVPDQPALVELAGKDRPLS